MTDKNDSSFRSLSMKAFTLVELLVVIVILTLLVAIVAPSINSAVELAKQTECRGKMVSLYKAAAAYASSHRGDVPIVHRGVSYGTIGELTTSGYAFAAEYLDQPTASGPKMTKVDNPFQCPSALDYNDPFDKTQSTNYSLSGFGLATSGSEGLHPKLSMIGGTVQKLADQTSSRKPSGQVAMIVDWIRERGSTSSNSQYNHEGGANVLYGSGEAKWVKYEALIRVSSVSGMLVPPSTYGFAKGGSGGTSIFAPDGKLIESGSGAQNARKAGVGVMW